MEASHIFENIGAQRSAKYFLGDEMADSIENHLLSQPLPLSLRRRFLCGFFDLELSEREVQATDNAYDSFFSRYALLCKLAANKDREVEKMTHRHLVDIMALVKDEMYPINTWRPYVTRGEMVSRIVTDPTIALSESLAETMVDLAAGLWLMLSISKYPGDISYDEPVIWERNQPLNSHIYAGLIPKVFPEGYKSPGLVKLPQSFTAAHLEQIGGIEVIWTSNLADHLLLKDDDTKLMLFHQVSTLQLHQKSPTTPLPKALLDETIRSISLLIPPILGKPNLWFQQQRKIQQRRKEPPIDAQAGVCGRLNSSERRIENFVYWRDRLVLLKRTFDDAEPKTISQLWWDDRKKTQWFTFWVAVLVFFMTVFFGIVQSVAGIVQAWASVQSLKATKGPS